MDKYVITGGPCTGKTTLINELAKLGYSTVQEAARMILKAEQQKPNGMLPWTNLSGFQNLIFKKQIELEDIVSGTPVFLDRGLFDNIAYCLKGNIEIPKELMNYAKTKRYTKIFLPDPLPYQKDSERKEDPKEAKEIHELIERVYRDLNYEIIAVPVLPPQKRAEYLIKHI